jgi:hypothetical protein
MVHAFTRNRSGTYIPSLEGPSLVCRVQRMTDLQDGLDFTITRSPCAMLMQGKEKTSSNGDLQQVEHASPQQGSLVTTNRRLCKAHLCQRRRCGATAAGLSGRQRCRCFRRPRTPRAPTAAAERPPSVPTAPAAASSCFALHGMPRLVQSVAQYFSSCHSVAQDSSSCQLAPQCRGAAVTREEHMLLH